VVHLGGLGVVVRLTLDIQPSFDICQEVFVGLPHAELDSNFDAIMGAAYSVSLFDDWLGDRVNQVWLKQRVANEDRFAPKTEFFGAVAPEQTLHPIDGLATESLTAQLGLRGCWYDRLPHFRIGQIPSAGEEIQSEYFVARGDALAAIQALRPLGPQFAPALMCTEIRSIAADDLWLSGSYQQETIGIHFTWHRDWPAVSKLLPLIEARLAPYNPRPHWGKTFSLAPAQVQSAYPKLPDFQALLRQYDPAGKFRNEFLEAYLL
jgi:xylitol oxidase